ncbi:unnamed protein product [Calicophoron daubneyi]|uniref:Uncharacterized protein n=1 Tax=Calicophoron daubneyi TaxID=300641 RepID=A0AAV2T7J1_CALDB
MVFSAADIRQQKVAEVQELLDALGADRKHTSFIQEDARRMAECATLSTQKIFAAFWEFLSRCQQSLAAKLDYPESAWVIMGPAYLNGFETIDEAHYSKEVSQLLDKLYEQSPVKRDMLCYIMSVLTEITQTAIELCRDRPALGYLARYQIAHLFGPILFSVCCESCKSVISETAKSCDYCSTVSRLLQKPYAADVLDRLLRYLPVEFWKNSMISVQRPTGARVDKAQIHRGILNMFCKDGPADKGKAKAPPSPVKGKQTAPTTAQNKQLNPKSTEPVQTTQSPEVPQEEEAPPPPALPPKNAQSAASAASVNAPAYRNTLANIDSIETTEVAERMPTSALSVEPTSSAEHGGGATPPESLGDKLVPERKSDKSKHERGTGRRSSKGERRSTSRKSGRSSRSPSMASRQQVRRTSSRSSSRKSSKVRRSSSKSPTVSRRSSRARKSTSSRRR